MRKLLFLLLMLLPLEVCADNLINGIYYNLNSSNLTATVVSHSGKKYSGNVVIPSTVTYSNETYTVTTIWDEAFYQCQSLTSISIPNSVTEIRQSAFEDCDGLTSITIPGSVTTIGNRAFSSCNYVTSITLSEGLETIGSYAFSAAGSLTSIVLPNGVKTIGDCAFYSCINLESITIPESVTDIWNEAFMSCSKLTSVTIPSGVTSIRYGTFQNCFGLTSVTIPNNVTSIGNYAFSSCIALTSIEIPNSVTSIGDGAFDNCDAMTSVTIPNSVTTIGSSAFSSCNVLTSVTIGNSVTSIGNYAFEGCNNLIYVTMNKETPPSIQSSVFSNRTNSTLYVPSNSVFTYIYADYWKEFKNISSIGTLRDINSSNISVNIVAKSLIYNGSAQTPDIVVKDGNITLINGIDYTLSYSNTVVGYGTITITGMGQYTGTRNQNFYISPKSLTYNTITISLPASVTYNGSAQTPAVTVKDGTTTLVSGTDYTVAYSNNTNAGTATVTVTGMGNYSGTKSANFTINPKNASNLTINSIAAVTYNGSAQTPTVTVKDGTTTLVSGTDYTVSYSNNTNAGTATVTVTGMGNYTGTKSANFAINKAPLTVTAKSYTITQGDPLPTFECTYSGFKNSETASVLTTQPTISCSATSNSAPGTYDIIVSGGSATNYAFTYVNGTLTIEAVAVNNIQFADNNVKTICVANWDTNGDGELSEAEAAAVTSLGTVFEKNWKIKSFNELQHFTGLTTIGSSSFYNCSGLTSVTIPNSVTSIGASAFLGCYRLTSITIPNRVTSIGFQAFYGCYGLTSITIPNSVTSISNGAFSICRGLTSIIVELGNTKYDSRNNCNAIIETASNTLLYGCKNTVIPNSVTSIGNDAFYYCYGLTSIIIPNSVTSIGNNVFYGCDGLTSVTIPNSVTSIGTEAFSGCSGLTSVTIPNSVTSIGDYAFNGCSKLTSVTVDINTPLTINAYTFTNRANATLYVPADCKSAYEAADVWKDFKEIVEMGIDITIGSAGMGTFCSTHALDFSGTDDIKAYIVSAFKPSTGEVTLTRITDVPANTGIVVKGDADTYNIPCGAGETVVANMLVGVTENTVLNKVDGDYTNYILAKKDNKLGFYAVTDGSTLSAGKAYLPLPTAQLPSGTGARQLIMVFDDETTGIQQIQSDVKSNGDYYDLKGRRVSTPTRGLYIVNGKKVVIK